MSLTICWPTFLVVLKVAMVLGTPPTGLREDTSLSQEGAFTANIQKEKSVPFPESLRYVRAAGGIENGGGLSLDDTSAGFSGLVPEDSFDPNGGSSDEERGDGISSAASSTTTAGFVPLSLLKNFASADILKYLRPMTTKSLAESNSAKWFLPPSFNLISGFPRHSRADSNFIRFGRSHNFGGSGFIVGTNKKNNFIRLGRENPKQNNFIRLGRSAGSDFRSSGKLSGYFPDFISATNGFDGGQPKRSSLESSFSNDYGLVNEQNSLDGPRSRMR